MRPLAEALDGAASGYERFCRAALALEWTVLPEQHENWYQRRRFPLGMFLDIAEFPRGYLKNHFPEGYARMVLSHMAFHEEWEQDFWNISREERKRCLTLGRSMYESYAIVKDQRMIPRSWAYLTKEIRYFAQENRISEARQSRFLDGFNPPRVLELGGSYSGDYTYLAVDRNRMLLVSCGIWD